MRLIHILIQYLALFATVFTANYAHAQDAARAVTTIEHTGVSGLWILANISYAGMRAQASQSFGWRITAFIGGFPGTFLSFFVIEEGSGRAYGIDIPKRYN